MELELHKNKEWLYQKYWNEKLSFTEMAKLCNVNHRRVSYWMKKHRVASPEEIKTRMSLLKMGEKNPRWNGGISEYPNHAILKRNRLEVLKIARGRCELCGRDANRIHHFDGKKDNHDLSNLVPLCNRCHWALHTGGEKGTSKYKRKYGVSIREMAEKFKKTHDQVYYRLRKEGQKWIDAQDLEIFSRYI